MLSIIYPYRNRDLRRIKNSLDSLQNQTTSAFEVFFVDYGSTPDIAVLIKELCSKYLFVKHEYVFSQFQPWSRSKALNSGIKNLVAIDEENLKAGAISESQFCFVADVDMVFHPRFVETAIKLQDTQESVYFQVGWLSSNDIPEEINAEKFNNYPKSTHRATGLTMFPLEVLKEIGGFDEFYHFWGAEDSDTHMRLKNAGYKVKFYNQNVLMLHQWHDTYKHSVKGGLSHSYQIAGIVQLNKKHLLLAKEHHRKKVNLEQWGKVMTQVTFSELLETPVQLKIYNQKSDVDAFLYGYLPSVKDQVVKVKFKKDPYGITTKYKIQKLLNRTPLEYYTLKEINDKLLLHLISFYRNSPYNFEIAENLQSITLAIKL